MPRQKSGPIFRHIHSSLFSGLTAALRISESIPSSSSSPRDLDVTSLVPVYWRKCFGFIVKDTVQNVGLRLAIAKQVPDELDVRTDNLPDGSVRVVVKGQKQDVRKFWEQLQKQVLGKAENPTFSQPKEIVEMPIEIDRFFHKLQCEQMEKFVDVGLDMKTSIDEMSYKIGGMDCKLDGVNFRLDGVNSTLSSMNSKLDTLPENIAMEMAKLRKNGLL